MLKIGQRAQDPVTGRVGVVASIHPRYALCIVPGNSHERFRLATHARRYVKPPAFELGQRVTYFRRTPGRTNNRLIRLAAIVVNLRPLRIRIDQPDQPVYHGRVLKPKRHVRPIA
jgi:hypothetical protein